MRGTIIFTFYLLFGLQSVRAQFSNDTLGMWSSERFYGAINYSASGSFGLNPEMTGRYHFLMNDIHGSLLYRLTPAFSAGIAGGVGFSFSSHGEQYSLQRIGLRGEYRLFANNPSLRQKFPLHIASELQSNYMWTKMATAFNANSEVLSYQTSKSTWYTMPVLLGGEFLLNPNRNRILNIYWTPEVGYAVPLGPQTSAPFQQSFVLNLLRFKLTFGK